MELPEIRTIGLCEEFALRAGFIVVEMGAIPTWRVLTPAGLPPQIQLPRDALATVCDAWRATVREGMIGQAILVTAERRHGLLGTVGLVREAARVPVCET